MCIKIEQSGATVETEDPAQAEQIAQCWAHVDPWHTVTVTSEDGASHVV